MKGCFLYLDAGKGHYTPAKVLAENFEKIDGNISLFEDIYKISKNKAFHRMGKQGWRFLLKYPRFERFINTINDNFVFKAILKKLFDIFSAKKLRAYILKEKPDFILCTNFIGPITLDKALKGLNIPNYYYVADVFDSPKVGLTKEADKIFISTQYGLNNIKRYLKKKKIEDRAYLVPFPIGQKFLDHKFSSQKQVREELSLEDKFTILINLGGEGINKIKIIDLVYKANLDIQFVLVGNPSKKTKKQLDKLKEKYKDKNIKSPGFIPNMPSYLEASNIQYGKAGMNSLLEAIYMKVPCLISDSLYAGLAGSRFVCEKKIGFSENNDKRQLKIIKEAYENENFKKEMDENFEKLGINYDVDSFSETLMKLSSEFKLKK